MALVGLLVNYTISSQHSRHHVSAVSKRHTQHGVLVQYVLVTAACEMVVINSAVWASEAKGRFCNKVPVISLSIFHAGWDTVLATC